MFTRLINWFKSLRARQDVSERSDLYKPAERLIYHYFNGEKIVHADPIVLYRRMKDRGPELAIDIRLANSIHSEAGKGYLGLVSKIRDIFALKPYEEGGLTEAEATDLLDHFLLFCEGVKKNSSPPVKPSEELKDTASSSAENQPTTNSSGSGSTAAESSTAKPDPLPMA